ncbi:Uncharacterised protein [uncultured archaeon]|nr:Uncharacterised protein [uncultured archaeon]
MFVAHVTLAEQVMASAWLPVFVRVKFLSMNVLLVTEKLSTVGETVKL